MKNQIIVHSSGKQVRTALIENGDIAQLFIESPENQRTVGDIYLAEVHKVMRGIRAAFISMGTPKDAFLHFSDTGENLHNYIAMLNGKDAIPKWFDQYPLAAGPEDTKSEKTGELSSTDEQNRMGALLQPKQKLMVQIVKEPIGSKGPRVSTNISIAGRFLVLMPMGDYVAVSKRIRSFKERRRLRSIVSSILPEGFGVIVRTVAQGQKAEALQEDLKDVLDKWAGILEKMKTAKPPGLLHRDMDMTESLIRDLFAKDYDRVLIDDPKLFKSIKTYVSRVAPDMIPQIQLYKGSEHIFDYMKISQDVESIFSPRVKMPSGGYLIFEQTEAMYVVDVNSGRYAAKRAQEDNSLKTNLEAAREIAKQLRLRDIGGIIVVDFIDLRDDVNRKKVYDELKKEFRKDRAKTNVLPMSDFGLVQITRQRIRPSVVKSVSKACPMCGGSGQLVSKDTILADLDAWLTKFRYAYKYRSVDMYVNPYLASLLQSGLISTRMKWMLRFWMRINITADESISMNDFKFTLPGSDIDITETVMHDEPIEEAIKENERTIADLPSEQKKDVTKLEMYKREKKQNGQARKDNYQNNNNRNQPDNRSNQKPKKSEPEKPAKAAAPSAPKEDVKQDRGRKGKVSDKYYKKDNEAEKAPAKATVAEEKKDKEEQPPLAIDVARAYKKKMEAQKEDEKAENEPSPATDKAKDADAESDTKTTANVSKSPSDEKNEEVTKSEDSENKADSKAEVKPADKVTEPEEKPKPARRGRPPKKKVESDESES